MVGGYLFSFRLPEKQKSRLYELKRRTKQPMRRHVLEALTRWIKSYADDPRSGSEPFDEVRSKENGPHQTLQISLPASTKAALERAAEERHHHDPRLWPDSMNSIAIRAIKEYLASLPS